MRFDLVEFDDEIVILLHDHDCFLLLPRTTYNRAMLIEHGNFYRQRLGPDSVAVSKDLNALSPNVHACGRI